LLENGILLSTLNFMKISLPMHFLYLQPRAFFFERDSKRFKSAIADRFDVIVNDSLASLERRTAGSMTTQARPHHYHHHLHPHRRHRTDSPLVAGTETARKISARSLAGALERPSGGSELILKSLAQLLGGLGHILTLPVYLRARRVLHRRVGPSHGVSAAEFRPRNPHALHVAQPRLHFCVYEESNGECLCSRADYR